MQYGQIFGCALFAGTNERPERASVTLVDLEDFHCETGEVVQPDFVKSAKDGGLEGRLVRIREFHSGRFFLDWIAPDQLPDALLRKFGQSVTEGTLLAPRASDLAEHARDDEEWRRLEDALGIEAAAGWWNLDYLKRDY